MSENNNKSLNDPFHTLREYKPISEDYFTNLHCVFSITYTSQRVKRYKHMTTVL